MSVAVEKPRNDIALQLEQMAAKFREALPKHIPVERFTRVVSTAIQQNPALLNVERRSLWQAAMKAAQDGLLPDGREAALVIYKKNSRVNGQWESTEEAQYMPMIAGIRKKVRNSGEIATWDVHIVHENDEFEFELGDDPYIKHRPSLSEPGRVIAAYSVATLKSGEKSREVMSITEIEKVRAASKAKDKGPWVDWFEEMARKTVARRHAKVLPMSTDLDDLIRQDDGLYDFAGDKDGPAKPAPRPTLTNVLDQLAAPKDHGADPETGEIGATPETDQAAPTGETADHPEQASAPEAPAPAPASTPADDEAIEKADEAGFEAGRKGLARRCPPSLADRPHIKAAWEKGFDAGRAAAKDA